MAVIIVPFFLVTWKGEGSNFVLNLFFSSDEGELFLRSRDLKLVLILSCLHALSSSLWLVYPFLQYLDVCLVEWYKFLFGEA